MNKAELINAIAASTELTKKDAEKALSATLEAITNALAEGDKVQIVGFGSYEVKKRAAHTIAYPASALFSQIFLCHGVPARAGRTPSSYDEARL